MFTGSVNPDFYSEGPENSKIYKICRLARQDLLKRNENNLTVMERKESDGVEAKCSLPFLRASRRVHRGNEHEERSLADSNISCLGGSFLESRNSSNQETLKAKAEASPNKCENIISDFKATKRHKKGKRHIYIAPELASLPHPSNLGAKRKREPFRKQDNKQKASSDVQHQSQQVRMKYHNFHSQGLKPILSATVKRMPYDCNSLSQHPSTTEKDNLMSMLQKKQIQREYQNYELIYDHPTRERSWPLWSNIEDKANYLSPPNSTPGINFQPQVYKTPPKVHTSSRDFIATRYAREE